MKKQCKVCDYKNAVRYGRADWRCPDCDRQLMLELVLMHEAENPQETKEVPSPKLVMVCKKECKHTKDFDCPCKDIECDCPKCSTSNKNIEGWEELTNKVVGSKIKIWKSVQNANKKKGCNGIIAIAEIAITPLIEGDTIYIERKD